MILVDTSVWIDHLRKAAPEVAGVLEAGQVLLHPFVIGEIALAGIRQRDGVLRLLGDLPLSEIATDEEVMRFIERDKLAGSGIGFVDAHLLAAVKLTAGTRLWTRDKRLAEVAVRCRIPAHGAT